MRNFARVCFALLVGIMVTSSGLAFATTSAVPKPTNGPGVAYTLILANNTLLKGNAPVRGGVTTPNPEGVAFDASNGDVYVAVPRSNSIIVIDGRTNLVADNITVGYQPVNVAYDSSNGYLYVANGFDDHVSVIDGSTNSVVANVSTGIFPTAVAVDSINGDVYVTQYTPFRASKVLVVNRTTNKISTNVTVPTIAFADGIVFDSVNGNIYVSSTVSNLVSVIAGGSLTLTPKAITGLDGPSWMAFDPANGCIYVAESNDTVAVINGTSNAVVASIVSIKDPAGLAYDPSNEYVYVTASGSNSVSGIDGESNKIVQNITVGRGPIDVVADPINGNLYVSNAESGSLSIIALPSLSPYPPLDLYLVVVAVIIALSVGFIVWRQTRVPPGLRKDSLK
jgi:YVTN family beta-propeller protein